MKVIGIAILVIMAVIVLAICSQSDRPGQSEEMGWTVAQCRTLKDNYMRHISVAQRLDGLSEKAARMNAEAIVRQEHGLTEAEAVSLLLDCFKRTRP